MLFEKKTILSTVRWYNLVVLSGGSIDFFKDSFKYLMVVNTIYRINFNDIWVEQNIINILFVVSNLFVWKNWATHALSYMFCVETIEFVILIRLLLSHPITNYHTLNNKTNFYHKSQNCRRRTSLRIQSNRIIFRRVTIHRCFRY